MEKQIEEKDGYLFGHLEMFCFLNNETLCLMLCSTPYF